MKALTRLCIVLLLASLTTPSLAKSSTLNRLKNLQYNTETMVSSGLPSKEQLQELKAEGVTHVIDLLPGDRSKEKQWADELGIAYTNIPVDWENPTLEDFQHYVAAMQSSKQGKTLTHCKLNWRGAVFTYLYRVTQLYESPTAAKTDLFKIWQPEGAWVEFMHTVEEHYQAI